MRSKQLWHLHNYVSELNTHYSHFLFISQEFIEKNRQDIQSNPDVEIKDFFGNNIYAKQFNVKLKELSTEYENTKQFILRGLFLLSYFQFEIYLRDIYLYHKSFFADEPELHHLAAVITQLNEIQVLSSLDPLSLKTIEYLQLRRNAIVHRDESHVGQGLFLDFINENGKALNAYWREKRAKQEVEKSKENSQSANQKSRTQLKVPKFKCLDFAPKKGKKKDNGQYRFADDEVIDILNLLRYLSESVDKCILNKIGIANFKKAIIDEFDSVYKSKERTKHQLLNDESRKRKLHHYLMVFYGISKEEFDIQG